MNTSKKIVLLGHFGVGKTSLVRRLVDEAFSEDYIVTLGVQVKKKDITVEKETYTLVIWDIEGNTSVSKARKSYLLGTHGFLYVFDVTRPETFQELSGEMALLAKDFPSIPCRVLANKSDLLTSKDDKEFFKSELFFDCIFTSAKNGDNVDQAFIDVIKNM